MPTEVYEEVVFSGDDQVTITYRHEATGLVSGVLFDGKPWVVEAKSIGALKELARERLAS